MANQKTKLHGRAFYESIGSPKVVLAPMVDQSEFAWRLLSRSFLEPNAQRSLLAYTPMFHAKKFSESVKTRNLYFQPIRSPLTHIQESGYKPSEDKLFLDGNPKIDRPLIVQFCSNDPEEILRASKFVQPYCDAVDLNLGCPQGIARKGHYGAFLQEEQDLVYNIIKKLHEELDVPVTAKIRILETKEKTLEYAKKILSAGASILAVHGRQRHQKSHATGLADWSVIRYLRDNLPPETVIFANGNVLRHQDIERCLKETGADGVMSAEGNLYDPGIFGPAPSTEGNADCLYWKGRNGKGGYRVDAVMRRYYSILYKYVLERPEPKRAPLFDPSQPQDQFEEVESEPEGPPTKKRRRRGGRKDMDPSLAGMQAHLFHVLRPLVTANTNVRDALAKCVNGDLAAFENVLKLTEKAVKEGLLDYSAHPEKYEDEDDLASDEEDIEEIMRDPESTARARRVCKRPWWVCQPRIRPSPKEAMEKGCYKLSKKELERQDVAAAEVADGEQAANGTAAPPRDEREAAEEGKVAEGDKRDRDDANQTRLPAQGIVCG